MEHEKWLVNVDNEVWGYVNNITDAKFFTNKIVKDLVDEFSKKYPKFEISTTNVTNGIKFRCIDRGYVYNTKFTHIIHYEKVLMLRAD